jgi:hypothetical protein
MVKSAPESRPKRSHQLRHSLRLELGGACGEVRAPGAPARSRGTLREKKVRSRGDLESSGAAQALDVPAHHCGTRTPLAARRVSASARRGQIRYKILDSPVLTYSRSSRIALFASPKENRPI